jgi:hypothetical protein
MRQRAPQVTQLLCNQMFSPFWHFTGCYSQNRPPSGTNNLLGTSLERWSLRLLTL